MAKPRHLTKASNKSNRGKQLPPRKRIDVSKLPKSERMRLTEYGLKIKELVDQERISGVPVPDDEADLAAAQLHETRRGLSDAMNQYQRYHSAYPNQHPANAFTPVLNAQNRHKGGAVENEAEFSDRRKQAQLPRKGISIILVSEPLKSEIEK